MIAFSKVYSYQLLAPQVSSHDENQAQQKRMFSQVIHNVIHGHSFTFVGTALLNSSYENVEG